MRKRRGLFLVHKVWYNENAAGGCGFFAEFHTQNLRLNKPGKNGNKYTDESTEKSAVRRVPYSPGTVYFTVRKTVSGGGGKCRKTAAAQAASHPEEIVHSGHGARADCSF